MYHQLNSNQVALIAAKAFANHLGIELKIPINGGPAEKDDWLDVYLTLIGTRLAEQKNINPHSIELEQTKVDFGRFLEESFNLKEGDLWFR